MNQYADASIYNLESSEALAALKSSMSGLTEAEAAHRLEQYGPNQLITRGTPLWRRLLEPFTSYFVIVIIVAALLSAIEQKWPETIIISAIVFINALIYYFQQFSVNRVIKTLRSQDRQIVRVIRDGNEIDLPIEKLVPGDLVHIFEGLKLPADGRLIEARHVSVDESVLTGESLPVHKQVAAISGNKTIYDQNNMLFKGTYIQSGSGLLVISKTGNQTVFGTINTLAAETNVSKTPTEKKIDDLTKKLLLGIICVSTAVFGLAMLRNIAVEEALRFTLSLTVSAVPEGLPVAITLVLLLSARRMAKHKALVKHISAIETMGAVTLIATDKTGTLTKNRLIIAEVQGINNSPMEFKVAIRAALNISDEFAADPLDKILQDSLATEPLPSTWEKVQDYPFDQYLRLSGSLWRHKGAYLLHVKGAPEQVLSHCQSVTDNASAQETLKAFTTHGYRTIAFAHATIDQIPDKLLPEHLKNMDLDGMVGLQDELRPHVASAIKQAHSAGIKVIMLTGDHVDTASHIAQRVGITTKVTEVSDSNILEDSNLSKIRKSLSHIKAFGRVLPENKYALLKAMHGYEITAMTGDGVNDIPALTQADVGLAMGSGTDAAKDASDIVLLNSNFHTIVNSIKMGRTVLANIRKMVVYLLGTSGGEVLTMLCALAIGMPLPITAVMVLWINLVTDGVVVIPLGMSKSEAYQMKHPPHSPKDPLLSRVLLSRAVLLAVVMAASTLTIFELNLDHGHAYAQTAAFITLIVMQWANAFNMNFEFHYGIHNISQPNYLLIGAVGVSILINILVFFTPMRQFFGIVGLTLVDSLIAIIIPVMVAFITCDVHKFLSKKFSTTIQQLD